MTRCYEYYCLFECNPDGCKLVELDPDTGKKKNVRGIRYIQRFMKFLKSKDVKFDKSAEDKDHFLRIVDEYGTEQVWSKKNLRNNYSSKKSKGEPRENVKLSDINDITLKDVDLILTDPPYPKEYLPLWETLFEKSYEGLREGGFLVTYTPHIYLPAIFGFKNKLNYVWTIAEIHTGSHTSYQPSRVNIGWKPLLVFVKGKMPDIEYFDDVLEGRGREKTDHEWQQALGESEVLIQMFTHEGDLVVDPFVGSGTTAIAARNTGRSFLVFDKDEKAIQATLRRLDHE